MPDSLHRADPAFGTLGREDASQDTELADERAWLASSLRCYLDNDLLEPRSKVNSEWSIRYEKIT